MRLTQVSVAHFLYFLVTPTELKSGGGEVLKQTKPLVYSR